MFIKHARAVISPSECYENCSMAILEAMSLGKPVIGSRIGGIPEQIRDGVEGIFYSNRVMCMSTRDGRSADLAEKKRIWAYKVVHG